MNKRRTKLSTVAGVTLLALFLLITTGFAAVARPIEDGLAESFESPLDDVDERARRGGRRGRRVAR